MKMKTKIGLGLIVLLILIQFIPVKKNIATDGDDFGILGYYQLEDDSEVAKILKTSCFDCHSNNTAYPWYNNIAPVSWFLYNHVYGAKKHLNFSDWKYMEESEKAHKIEECIEMIETDEMPLSSYTLIHQDAKLSEEEKIVILEFFKNL